MTWARWWESSAAPPAVVGDVPAVVGAEDQGKDTLLAAAIVPSAVTPRAQPLLFDIPEAPGRPAPRVIVGDTRVGLAQLEPGSAHCVVTSPPYWGLRDYGLEPVIWADGWVGCLGLEPNPEQYVEHLLEVIDVGLRRVLRSDGTLWLNLGDCYASNGGHSDKKCNDRRGAYNIGTRPEHEHRAFRAAADGVLKPKNLVRIPARVAAAMQTRGWYLRSEIPWVKRNVLPSSVKDRPTTAHETVFLFVHPESKGRCFYDVEAVKVASTQKPQRRKKPHKKRSAERALAPGHPPHRFADSLVRDEPAQDSAGTRQLRDSDFFFDSLRQLRDDLTTILDGGEGLLHGEDGDPLALVVNPRPFKEAHFAVFPPQLVEPMVKAGTSEHGVCCTCGAPWRRVVKVPTQGAPQRSVSARGGDHRLSHGKGNATSAGQAWQEWKAAHPNETLDWQPTCSCLDNAPIPATVLDPFGGAGTTSLVASSLGRASVYLEQGLDFVAIAQRRWAGAADKDP